jgi:membrane-associated phospholipid phosphatase
MVEWIYEAGIAIILFLQGMGEWMVAPMGVFTSLGDHTFYLFVLALLYWSVNARVGLRLGLLMMISGGINYLFKIWLAGPRPYWFDARVLALSTEATFGVPSGHAQQAVVLWGLLAFWVKRGWAYAGAVLLVVLIGVSRLYLGVHFPHDVILGWMIGLSLLAGFIFFEKRGAEWLRKFSPLKKVLLAFGASILLILIALLVNMSMRNWTLPETWQEIASQAAPDARPLDPLNFAGMISGAGGFFGLAAGAIWIGGRGGYQTTGTWIQRLTRLPVGGAGAAMLFLGLGSLLPEAGWTAPILQYLLHAAIGFWVAGLAPRLFQLTGLAARPLHP